MREQLLLLLRISKPEYNKTLYEEHRMFMNPQMSFKNDKLTEGQQDKYEGAIVNIPCKILYSADEKQTWHSLGDTSLIRKDNHAYIYCMYGLKYDRNNYDVENNRYRYVIPWEFIKPLWQGDDTELMLVLNTSVFIAKFKRAAEKLELSYAYGKIHYDLESKLTNIEYCDLAMRDCFESVYHKVGDGYENQQEIRFTVICPNKPNHMELQLVNDEPQIHFTLIPLKYGRNIMIELVGLQFDEDDKELKFPIRFSTDIRYYESAIDEN